MPERPASTVSSSETEKPVRKPFDVLLAKLALFLKTLGADELANMPDAAAALARRPRGARSVLHPRQPQPIEVVFARVGGEVVGALLLRRKWMENTIAAHFDGEQQQSERPKAVSDACQTWMHDLLPQDLHQLLSLQAAFLPESEGVFNHGDVESILELLESSTPEAIGRWLQVPFVLRVLQRFGSQGRPQERRRVKTILRLWSPRGQGAPSKDPDKRRDVRIAEQVDEAKTRLRTGFELRSALRGRGRVGGYATSRDAIFRELLKQGHDVRQATAIALSRTLAGAAQRLVAAAENIDLPSIRSMASRGKNHLGRR